MLTLILTFEPRESRRSWQVFPPSGVCQENETGASCYKGGAAGLLQHHNETHLDLLHTKATITFIKKKKNNRNAEQDVVCLPVSGPVQLRLLAELQLDGS